MSLDREQISNPIENLKVFYQKLEKFLIRKYGEGEEGAALFVNKEKFFQTFILFILGQRVNHYDSWFPSQQSNELEAILRDKEKSLDDKLEKISEYVSHPEYRSKNLYKSIEAAVRRMREFYGRYFDFGNPSENGLFAASSKNATNNSTASDISESISKRSAFTYPSTTKE